jgi:hypothetical protein
MTEASAAWKAIRGTDQATEYQDKASCAPADSNAAGCSNQQRKCLTGRLIDKLLKLVRQHIEHCEHMSCQHYFGKIC